MNPSSTLVPISVPARVSAPRTVPFADPFSGPAGASAAAGGTNRLPSGPPDGLTVEDAQRIAAAIEASHAESTRRLYGHLWRVWERWCTARGVPALPADPAALSAYLVERAADGIAVVSLDLACVAIRYVHRTHGYPNPSEEELVRQVRQGLRRLGSLDSRRGTVQR